MGVFVPSGEKVGFEGASGDTYIDYSSGMRLVSDNVEILKNIGKLVDVDNTSQSIGAASSYTLKVALTDSGYTGGVLFLSQTTSSTGTANFGVWVFGTNTSKAAGLSAGSSASYLAFYNKIAGGVNYISHRMFSSLASDVAITSIAVNGTNLEITFYNHAVSSRTLNARGYAFVVKGR